MLNSARQRTFSDGTVRRFLLAQLSPRRHSSFETTLIGSSVLEQRVRLAEVELLDDYAQPVSTQKNARLSEQGSW